MWTCRSGEWVLMCFEDFAVAGFDRFWLVAVPRSLMPMRMKTSLGLQSKIDSSRRWRMPRLSSFGRALPMTSALMPRLSTWCLGKYLATLKPSVMLSPTKTTFFRCLQVFILFAELLYSILVVLFEEFAEIGGGAAFLAAGGACASAKTFAEESDSPSDDHRS